MPITASWDHSGQPRQVAVPRAHCPPWWLCWSQVQGCRHQVPAAAVGIGGGRAPEAGGPHSRRTRWHTAPSVDQKQGRMGVSSPWYLPRGGEGHTVLCEAPPSSVLALDEDTELCRPHLLHVHRWTLSAKGALLPSCLHRSMQPRPHTCTQLSCSPSAHTRWSRPTGGGAAPAQPHS